jgi:hypothetical protein
MYHTWDKLDIMLNSGSKSLRERVIVKCTSGYGSTDLIYGRHSVTGIEVTSYKKRECIDQLRIKSIKTVLRQKVNELHSYKLTCFVWEIRNLRMLRQKLKFHDTHCQYICCKVSFTVHPLTC